MNRASIIRSDDLRAENRYRILRTLRREGPISRAHVGKLTGLSQASLSNLMGLMTDQGILASGGRQQKPVRRGRPQTALTLNHEIASAVTVALSIDKLTVCVVDYAGETVLRHDHEPKTRSLGSEALSTLIVSAIQQAMTEVAVTNLQAISFCFQGMTDSHSGELQWSPILSMNRFPITQLLEKTFSVPVSVNNDCAYIAQALSRLEPTKLGSSFAALSLSHGVGMGLYLSGKPVTGARSSAMEFGHIKFRDNGARCRCGKRGCIEAYTADYAIVRAAMGLSQDEVQDDLITKSEMADCIEMARRNDKAAVQAFSSAGQALGAGLAAVFTLLDPVPVALVGQISQAIDLYRDDIEKAVSSVGRTSVDYTHLIHCFDDDEMLFHAGLVVEATRILDRVCADKLTTSVEAEVN